MAWVSLSDALEMALKRLEIDCAATAGTDADAEKMAESVASSRPSQGGSNNEGTKGIAGQGEKPGNANREHMPTAPPTGRNKLTGNPNAHAPARPVSLFLIVDNGAREVDGGGVRHPPSYRSNRRGRTTVRETGLMLVHSAARPCLLYTSDAADE